MEQNPEEGAEVLKCQGNDGKGGERGAGGKW